MENIESPQEERIFGGNTPVPGDPEGGITLEQLQAERRDGDFLKNIERFQSAIEPYLMEGLTENFPEEFQEPYRTMFEEHRAALAERPISPNCKLTLVLPAYREEDTIIRALDSLSAQTGVSMDEFEVIVVNNYPEGAKPRINEYDDAGEVISTHEDQTAELVREYQRRSPFVLHVIDQTFPKEVAGVAVASKLGMDIALDRQKEHPGVIAWYGSDTEFGAEWIQGALGGLHEPGIDGVRGYTKSSEIDPVVIDERGAHRLDDETIKKIVELEHQRWQYSDRLHAFRRAIDRDEPRIEDSFEGSQSVGLPVMTAGVYAKIGGMKVFKKSAFEARPTRMKSGEDITIANDVAREGSILQSKIMRTVTKARIVPPRTDQHSYSGGLWSMYRAVRYGEGDVLDSEQHLIVEDPEYSIFRKEVGDLLKREFASLTGRSDGLGDKDIEQKLLDYMPQEELNMLIDAMKKTQRWEDVPGLLSPETITRFERIARERFPRLPVDEANNKLERMVERLGLENV